MGASGSLASGAGVAGAAAAATGAGAGVAAGAGAGSSFLTFFFATSTRNSLSTSPTWDTVTPSSDGATAGGEDSYRGVRPGHTQT